MIEKKLCFEELIEFIKLQNEFFMKKDNFSSHRECVLAHTTKLMEESGEFANEILTSLGLVRKEKMRENSKELAKECADVLIVVFLLAEKLNIDIQDTLKEKIEIIKERQRN